MADDDTFLCAIEQYLYWREIGLSHSEMLVAVGLIYGATLTHSPQEVVAMLGETLRLARREQPHRRAA